jgi:hypothetical protein
MGYNEWLKDFFATWEYLRRIAKNVLTKDINGLEPLYKIEN